MNERILFLGENWYGSCARACCYALRRLGCDVIDIDSQTFIPPLQQLTSRIALRIFSKRLTQEYNNQVLHIARNFQPDILLAFKAPYVEAKTLRTLQQQNIALYNYYPDRMVFIRGTKMESAIPEYDCIFDTKRFWDDGLEQEIKVKKRVFLPHGYDSQLHRRINRNENDRSHYECDASFIGTYSPRKEPILRDLLRAMPELNVKIWGSGWLRYNKSPELKKFIQGEPLTGDRYVKAILASRINLAIMGVTETFKDETTTRTYEIPACGGFMLHERSEEVLELFEEGKEIACFDSTTELVEKLAYYLAHPEEREAIARAGYARCVPAYSYDNRMLEILKWHAEHYGK